MVYAATIILDYAVDKMVYAVQRHAAVVAIIAMTLDELVNLIPESDDFVITRTKLFLDHVHVILLC
jgi:hypothetical protein